MHPPFFRRFFLIMTNAIHRRIARILTHYPMLLHQSVRPYAHLARLELSPLVNNELYCDVEQSTSQKD
ncbi:hypothetical protein IC235_08180 [Hymenobacter sp. BT664]|uniref:Uncharacterized protein n=1 Tax=Hymenobacter montanus TaxID=2771359 RepID=A0A927BCY8_9BACT|nr:hypothetical protein [Hymenobacter montanus]MBD2767869.1 hypothetical protein [Hymenobacter montanus]